MTIQYSRGLELSLTEGGGDAIPDSEADQKLTHRWVLDDVGTGTAVDSVGSADGTVNGVSNIDGDWAGGSAGDGDGTDDYIDTTTLGDFGSNADSSDFAIAFSMKTTDDSWLNAVADDNNIQLYAPWMQSDGAIAFRLASSDLASDRTQIHTDNSFNDGNEYRVVLNKTGTSASDFEIWTNQSQESTTTDRNDSFSGTGNSSYNWPIFAWNDNGSIKSHGNTILDDYCIYGDSLTQTEIESYNNPWS